MTPKVLIVEDEPAIAELLSVNLRHNGYKPVWVQDAEAAQREVDAVLPDLVLLDWMLPGQSGLALAKAWRAAARTKALPIIMLTAKNEESDTVVGLELGADDYVTKPFSPKTLVARVKSLFRRLERTNDHKPTSLVYDSLQMDLTRHEVTVRGKEVLLTAKEFGLLEHLLRHPGRVLTREVLLNEVWGYDYYGTTRTVDVHVRRLKLKVPILNDSIVSVKTLGYKLLDQARV